MTQPELLRPESLYSSEIILFAQGLLAVNLEIPIFYRTDVHGNLYVTDGNHRAYIALATAQSLLGVCICHSMDDISRDPMFRKISQLKIQH